MTRFTETAKWRDPWFGELSPHAKLVFLYVVDSCDNAGFWEMNERDLLHHTGLTKAQVKDVWVELSRGVVIVNGWAWVRRFLHHQKNESLNPENRAHKQILRLIDQQRERFAEVLVFEETKAPSKPLASPSEAPTEGLQCSPLGIGKGQGKGLVLVEGEHEGKPNPVDGFEEFWRLYPKKEARKDCEAKWRRMTQEQRASAIQGLAKFNDTPKWKNGYAPMPMTYLNGERWSDEVPVEPVNGQHLTAKEQEYERGLILHKTINPKRDW